MKSKCMTIGFCLTRLGDETNSLLTEHLRALCAKNGARLIVFNSLRDFFRGDDYDKGAAAVFDLADGSLLDALVIQDQGFYNKPLVQSIIRRAQQQNLPVITLYAAYSGCFSVMKYYDSVFASLIRHVITEHHAQDVRLIAGNRTSAHTVKRERIFRDTLLSCGLACTQESVSYCDDWAGPVHDTVNRWCAEKDLPDAIVCAGDSMARAALDTLAENGVRVPEQVLVTGFDGLPSVLQDYPGLTTCVQDLKATAECVMRMADEAVNRHAAPYSAPERYSLRLSATCGCAAAPELDDHAIAREYHECLGETVYHEEEAFNWADHILASKNTEDFSYQLCRSLPENSMLALFEEQSSLHDTADAYFAQRDQRERVDSFEVRKIHPMLDNVLRPGEAMVVQSVHIGGQSIGYLTMIPKQIRHDAMTLSRAGRMLNLAFTAVSVRRQHDEVARQLTQIRLLDPDTGLPNMNGLNARFTKKYDEWSRLSLAVSVYEISQFERIREKYGLEAADGIVQDTARLLQKANEGDLIARIASSTFVVFNLDSTPKTLGETIDRHVAAFYAGVSERNANRGSAPIMEEINCGCIVAAPGWKNDLLSLIKGATSEMYLNRMKYCDSDKSRSLTPVLDEQVRLDLLLRQNLFRYYFQPIVGAHSGRIVAYEALMRTRDPIAMPPMEVLAAAVRQNKLYAIERATMFNILAYVDEHRHEFAGRNIYINTIPGSFLTDEDRAMVKERYGHLLPQCTFEITEMNDITDEELELLRNYGDGDTHCKLAIDDFGTGFSNIVNLLRYHPDIVKIDRYLVTNVHQDVNKQLFIRNTVEFARMNGILVLAEGVETREELSKVIELGVDLIQGFIAARPSPEVIDKIPDEICHFMMDETFRFAELEAASQLYEPHDGEVVSLIQNAVEKHPGVLLNEGSYTLNGEPEYSVSQRIVIADHARVRVLMRDVCIRASAPAVTLGQGSSLEMIVAGHCVFNYQGIRVPEGARLMITGDGNLEIHNDQKNGAVLGGTAAETCGSIRVDMTGSLKVESSAENAICIGAGRGTETVELLAGHISLNSRGVHSVNAGCFEGRTEIIVGRHAEVSTACVGVEAAGIGAISGNVSVTVNGSVSMEVEGSHIAGIGVLNEGTADVKIEARGMDLTLRGENSVGMGSDEGRAQVRIASGLINQHMEGANTCMLGSMHGSSDVRMSGGDVHLSLLSGNHTAIGEHFVVTGGSLMLARDASKVAPFGPHGEKLVPSRISEQTFERNIRTAESEYIYRAGCLTDKCELCVWLPEA